MSFAVGEHRARQQDNEIRPVPGVIAARVARHYEHRRESCRVRRILDTLRQCDLFAELLEMLSKGYIMELLLDARLKKGGQ